MVKREFFDQVACGKDPLLFTPEDIRKVQRLKTRLGSLDGRRILEPGCGVGPLTEYLSEWVGLKGDVLAFDESPGMVSRCRERLSGKTNVRIEQASVETIALKPAFWDVIILFRVFPHFDDKPGVLRRLKPCLAPGGRLVIANLEGSTRLNALHASFSAPVQHDHMPCARGTASLLGDAGYRVQAALDEEDGFFVEAGVC